MMWDTKVTGNSLEDLERYKKEQERTSSRFDPSADPFSLMSKHEKDRQKMIDSSRDRDKWLNEEVSANTQNKAENMSDIIDRVYSQQIRR